MPRSAYNPQIVLKNGKPSAVILNIDSYEAMLERLEQIEDLRAIRSLRASDRESRPFNEYVIERRKRVSR